MLEKFIHFIKYNNATIIILAVILIASGGALAAGPEAIGQKQTSIQGVDNAVLLAVDLDKFSMDFKIEKIEQDENYYYATYSYLDIAVVDNAWQYQLSSRTQKISKKIKEDIGAYLAKFLAKHYEARLRELKDEKVKAETLGAQNRVEVTEYSGLVGRTLDLAAKVFPGYEPVKRVELPAPDLNAVASMQADLSAGASAKADNLTQIYNDYLAAHDGDKDGILDAADNCPGIANADQLDTNGNRVGDVCDSEPAGGIASTTPLIIDPPADDTASSTPLIEGDEGGSSASSTPAITETPATDPGTTDQDADSSLNSGDSGTVQIIDLPATPAE